MQAESSRRDTVFQILDRHLYGQAGLIETERQLCPIAERPARLAVMPVHKLCALPIMTRHIPHARPTLAVHGMAHAGPVLLELEFLAIKNETAICNAIGERHHVTA